jgi:DNA-binding transcriptional ArsR family regulator
VKCATQKSADPQCAPAEHGGKRRVPQVPPRALDRAVRLFKALADEPRLRVLAVLAQGEACVTELAELDGGELSTTSQRLRVLRAADLVTRRRDGKHVLYGLADQHIADLIFNALAHASEGPVETPSKERKGNINATSRTRKS